jgi:hypothetical protein
MSPKEFNKYVKAYEEKLKEQDTLNWLLGKYIAIGVNNPKSYPSKPVLRKEEVTNNVMTDTEIEEKMKTVNKLLGGKEK